MACSRIIVDERERPSGVPAALERLGVGVTYRMLDVGDYLVSNEVAVERKQASDLMRSLYEGRLFEQAERLSELYSTPMLVVEDSQQALYEAIANRKALWGALASLSMLSGIHVLQTSSAEDTALLLQTLAARQVTDTRGKPIVSFRRLSAKSDIAKTQLAIVSALPGIGSKLAHRLLSRHGTVRSVFPSPAAELSSVRGIGPVKAEGVVAFLDRPYARRYLEQLRLST